MRSKHDEWRELAEAALDNRLGPDWPGDPDSNVMQLARAVIRLLEDIRLLKNIEGVD